MNTVRTVSYTHLQKDIDLIGSVTAEILDRSRTAVLAIPENTPFKEFNEVKRIAFLTLSLIHIWLFQDMQAIIKSRGHLSAISISVQNLTKR